VAGLKHDFGHRLHGVQPTPVHTDVYFAAFKPVNGKPVNIFGVNRADCARQHGYPRAHRIDAPTKARRCPFNARARAPVGTCRASTPVDERFEAAPQWKERTLGDLLALDEVGFEQLRRGTPVARATRVGLARNAAVVMGNRDDPADLEPLARAHVGHDAAIVREAAGWALARISSRRR